MSNPQVTAHDWYFVFEFERRAYPVQERPFTIGRDADGDVVILEPNVSRAHARVTRVDGECVVENLGSTGTRVNGIRIDAPRTLLEGDRVEVGMAVLTLRRPPLPLGVAVAGGVRARPTDLVTARRPTVRSPLLLGAPETVEKWQHWRTTALLAVVFGALALLYVLRAG